MAVSCSSTGCSCHRRYEAEQAEIAEVDAAVAGARAYASRWSVAQWFAYAWMLDQILAGHMKYLAVST